MTAAGFTFDLLTIVLMGGVIAMIVSTTLMVIDMMPGRRVGTRLPGRDALARRLSPGAARLIAQARERAALASADPGLIASQLGLDGIDRAEAGGAIRVVAADVFPAEPIVLPPGAVTIAPRPPHEPIALPSGPVIEVPAAHERHDQGRWAGPVIDVPVAPVPGERLSFYEASSLASHLAHNDPERIVEVIQQWLRNDARTYEEDV